MLGTKLPTQWESRIEWWRRLIARQQSAQTTLAQFCREVGITTRMFYYWKKRVRGAATTPSIRRVPAPQPLHRATAPARGVSASFVPVSIVGRDTAAELEIELANGRAIRLKGSVASGLLQVSIAAAGQLGGSGRGGC